MIVQFPKERSRLYGWAQKYVDLWCAEGWLPASKYVQEYIPQQMWQQVRDLIDTEFLKRGIQVEF